ncbi:MAG: type II secretion system F family protein [Phototrophicaceae bacterium]
MALTIGAIVAIIVAIGVIVFAIISARSESDLLEQRLSSADQGRVFTPAESDTAPKKKKNESNALLAQFDDALSEREFSTKWRQQLERADIKLTVAEYAVVHVLSMIAFFMLSFFLFFAGNIVVGILAGFIGFFAPRIYVARQVSQRLIRFEEQLPDTLSLWVNALRSGYSVLQSLDAIARDSAEPTATEFHRVIQETQLGIDLADALAHLLARVDSADLDLVVTAVNIQREVGGNLAEILDVIGHTIRERIKLKGEVRVLTTQGRVTGYLISFMPIILALFLNVVSPGFMGPVFEDRCCGWPMLGLGLALIGMGTAVIQKIIDIEI